MPEVLPLVRAYLSKTDNGAGGSLHIFLDDGNIDDGSLRFCAEAAKESGDADGEALCAVLAEMSKTQRRKLCTLRDGPRAAH